MDKNIREKIIKCLELIASDSDGEALNAVRKANKFLKDSKKSWTEFFSQGGSAKAPFGWNSDDWFDEFVHKHKPTPDRETQHMLEVVLASVRGSARGFIESLADQFRVSGSLSQKQKSALRKFYQNCTD